MCCGVNLSLYFSFVSNCHGPDDSKTPVGLVETVAVVQSPSKSPRKSDSAKSDSAKSDKSDSASSSASHSASRSPSRHSMVAESIATLGEGSVVLEETKTVNPIEVPVVRGKKRGQRQFKKFHKKYLKKEVRSVDAADKKQKAPVFSQSAISAGPEPDDLQVTFSWDTQADWDTSLQLKMPDLIEDCVISVLAR